MKLRLATRGSKLAWAQSGMVADLLRAHGHEVELVRVTTHGDVTTAPLASLGGSGVFVGAVRAAVLAGEADLAVHSFKDLPTEPNDDFVLAAVPEREDLADALCARDGLSLVGLPAGARVGTGSPRRAAQLLLRRPDLEPVAIRGNVETRLSRVGADLDAVLLAAAGLRRLGLAAAITERLDPSWFLPAPAQGALALECRADASDELRAALAEVDDPASRAAALAERAVLLRLQAGCAAPVAAHASVADGQLELVATVTAVDGTAQLTEHVSGASSSAEEWGRQVADQLLAAGAADLVDLSADKPKPLAGRTILVPERAPSGTAATLTAAGADVILAAFTEQQPLPLDELRAALAEDWDWLVVSSAKAVPALVEALAGRPLNGQLAAVGPATAAALTEAGLTPTLVAQPANGAALVAAFPAGPGRILIPGAADHSLEPTAGLVAKGWDVYNVAIYRTISLPLPESVVSRWQDGTIDAFIVTAGSVARSAVASAGLPGPKVVALGPSSARVASELGFEVAATATRPLAAALADATLTALT
jgi:hydroxymethylbilane synthase